jgi:hypothetical protein
VAATLRSTRISANAGRSPKLDITGGSHAFSHGSAVARLRGRIRRDGQTIYYSLADGRARPMIEVIHEMFFTVADPGK